MTLDNLQYALYLNNRIILNRIKNLKDAIDDIINTDIDELKKLIEDINDTDLANINQLITDLDTDLSNHTSDTVVHVTQDDKDLWNATLQNAKDYAKKLFDGVTSFTIEIVDTLPTEDIKSMTIYFIRNEHDNESDYYEEYMYINNKWEIIGSTYVNLAPYLLKTDFEKYQQEITDKFAKYNTSDEITNILKDYLLTPDFNNIIKDYLTTQTFNDTIKNYITTQTFDDTIKNYTTTEALQKILEEYAKTEDIHTHENKDIIDKLSESDDGNLLFNGQEIKGGSGSDITISEEANNAIQQKDDGIFVEDKSEQIDNIQTKVNQISIAQKTSLEKSYIEDILYDKIINSTGIFELLNNIQNYDEIIIEHGYGLTDARQFKFFKVSELEYNSNVVYHVSHGNGSANSYINFKFINNLSIQITHCVGSECIFKIIGIKYNQITIDPVEYINTTQGIEDTPVGHIIAHMGTIAPKHYLICDGTEYSIIDYPYLAQHFMDEFGSYNYFGGDGITTFAVPDLRGEFLRGTGTAIRNTGSGANTGIHQDGTEMSQFIDAWNIDNMNALTLASDSNMTNSKQYNGITKNVDKYVQTSTGIRNMLRINITDRWTDTVSVWGETCRPTNTSVLYCIKYEPTYYMTVGEYTVQGFEDYSEEEKVIGRWIDGRPIYRKVIVRETLIGIAPHNITAMDNLINYSLKWYDTTDKVWYDRFRLYDDSYGIAMEMYVSTDFIYIYTSRYNEINWNARTSNIYVILEYTKTTDAKNSFTPDMLSTIIISGNKQEDLTEEELNNLITDTINLLNE